MSIEVVTLQSLMTEAQVASAIHLDPVVLSSTMSPSVELGTGMTATVELPSFFLLEN